MKKLRADWKQINWVNHIVELLVVVIGVTVAFQLENWKEGNRTDKLRQQYYKSMASDLKKDVKELQLLADTSNHFLRMNKRLTECIVRRDLEHDSLFFFFLGVYNQIEFTAVDNTYESMKASGSLTIVDDFELRQLISEVYSQVYQEIHLHDQFQKRQFFDNLYPYISEHVVFTGRPVLKETDFLRDNRFINMSFSAYFASAQKQKAYRKGIEKASLLIRRLEEKL